jgi:CheY-like chemotaxis protein
MEAVGQLTSGIAHNLNNVLAIIVPSVDEAVELASGELVEIVEGIGHAARRGAEMVRQLTLFARPHAGAAKGPFDLAATVSRIVDMCQKTFQRSVVITLDVADVPLVQGNEGQVEQVILNLCLNARDAVVEARRAEPRIDVTVSAVSPDRVRVAVRDNGVGIDESVRARVFEPFFTTKGVGHGTGLGLATAYAVVVDHQGQIRCKSERGAGTTFEIELPASGGEGVPRASAPPRVASASRDEHVLVVEDEAQVRSVIVRMLGRAGYRVTACADGREALALVEGADAAFDAILLDRSMPGLGGEQVMERLRTLGVTTPVILLTGDPGSAAGIPGVSMVLGKPIGNRGLLGNLRRVLDDAATSSRAS